MKSKNVYFLFSWCIQSPPLQAKDLNGCPFIESFICSGIDDSGTVESRLELGI